MTITREGAGVGGGLRSGDPRAPALGEALQGEGRWRLFRIPLFRGVADGGLAREERVPRPLFLALWQLNCQLSV